MWRRLFLLACWLVAGGLSAATAERRLAANDADVTFALKTVESALKQYLALPDARKRKLERQVARAAGVADVATVSQTLRTLAAVAAKAPLDTKENREATRVFLDANQKWCATVKAARVTQQAMLKMGIKGADLSLDDIVNLLPE